MNDNIKVSVCVTTYNQEQYIGECLESIVTQKCDFDFEVIVGEDCSTDSTRIIVEEYADKYPNIIKPIFHEVNIGGEANYFFVHNQAKGKYICVIDGDDLALPDKLQIQANFMDNTPDCNISFHRVKRLFPDGTLKNDLINYEKLKGGFERKDLLQYMAVAMHSSKMYRNELKNFDMPNFVVSDFYMNVEQIKDKKAYFINDRIYGVYRTGIGQSTNSKVSIRDFIIKTLDLFTVKYHTEKKYINSLYFILFLADMKNKRNFIPYFKGWVKTFNFFSIFLVVKTWHIRKMFRIKQ